MLEKFQEQHRAHPVHAVEARVLWALYRIRRSPKDLHALVALIGTGQKSDATLALPLVENLDTEAIDAVPQIQELIAQVVLNVEVKNRLELFLARLAREKSAE